jgi:hemolysin III
MAAHSLFRHFLRPREPFNGLSHFTGALLSIIGLFVLINAVWGRFWPMVGVCLYGSSLILLYSASALYHSLHVSPRAHDWLGRFDYCAIFLLIAGTYAPLCLVTLRGAGGGHLIAAEYGLAVAGILGVLLWNRMPDWIRWALYVIMGWLLLPVLPRIRTALPPAAIDWLLGGGAAYMLGAVVLAFDQPKRWPNRKWVHGLWHVFVLGGSACHFVVVLRFIASPV